MRHRSQQHQKKPVVLSEAYWNEKLGYGFRGSDSDTYQSQGSENEDHVKVTKDGVIYSDASVKVSFYKDKTLAFVERIHNSPIARAFSTLPNGIAVIEGNLESPTAKTILATLHAE